MTLPRNCDDGLECRSIARNPISFKKRTVRGLTPLWSIPALATPKRSLALDRRIASAIWIQAEFSVQRNNASSVWDGVSIAHFGSRANIGGVT